MRIFFALIILILYSNNLYADDASNWLKKDIDIILQAYKNENIGFKLENCEIFSKKIFSLPIYPYLEKNKIKKIIKTLNNL